MDIVSIVTIIVSSGVIALLAFIGYMEYTRPKESNVEIQYPIQD